VILEVVWAGTLAIPVGSLAAGDEMRAYFAVFIALRDGRIYRQRNYDCFEPF
jgi:ketosteroid isomerase-like protein